MYDVALEPLGINIAQYFLLRAIGDHQPVSLSGLGRIVDLDRSTVGRNARVLEHMALLSMARGEVDQREAVVSLTRTGTALMRKATPFWEDCQAALLARLGENKVEALRAALSLI